MMGDVRNFFNNANICFLEYCRFHLADNFHNTLAKQNFPETLEGLTESQNILD